MTSFEFQPHSIRELPKLMSSGEITGLELTQSYLKRIEALNLRGPAIRAVIETNPDAEEIAAALDKELRSSGPRSPLHGIPIVLKDNIDTADRMQTTAGSLALEDVPRIRDASVALRLRDAGAILLGKANMSEWANFRSTKSSSGWSARGGQALNPYALDRTPCGSSSGSGSAVAAGFAPASLGTETAGSILCPASMCGVVGIKPTVGLTSRTGVVPISHTQDTVGPMALTVADAAAVLTVIAGQDSRDLATLRGDRGLAVDYTAYLEPDGLRGARIGVPRGTLFGYSQDADRIAEAALLLMAELGAEIVDPADFPSTSELKDSRVMVEILLYEFKANIESYLAGLGSDDSVRTLADLIRFNEERAAEEMPFFRQELFEQSQAKGPLSDTSYMEAVATARRLSRDEGIDAIMDAYRLDALVGPTTSPAFRIDHKNGDAHVGSSDIVPAMAGYPAITVPVGYAGALPVGITFIGRAFGEPTLIRLAHAFETAAAPWRMPRFLPTQA